MMTEHEARGTRSGAAAKRLAVRVRRHAVALLERAREVELARKTEPLGDVGEPELRPLEDRRGEFDAQRLRALDGPEPERILEEPAQVLRRDVHETRQLGQSERPFGMLVGMTP